MRSQRQPTRMSIVKWAIAVTPVALVFLVPLTLAPTASATPGEVLSHQKISDTQGGFTGTLDSFPGFGSSVASLGDLDGDGVGDLAVGAFGDDDGGPDHGAAWVLFLNPDGTVKAHQKISATQGGFTGGLTNAASYMARSSGALGMSGPWPWDPGWGSDHCRETIRNGSSLDSGTLTGQSR